MAFQKILGFAPDRDVVTPGVVMDCSEWIPFEAGYKGAPSAVSMGVAALASECRGAAVLTKLDGTRRLFAGTQTKLYELAGTTWTDRSAGGGSYAGSVESRWSFCQFGDTSMASNLVDAMQASTAGAFAAIAGAPKALVIIAVSNNFVIALRTNDGTYGDSPDRWWCCAQSNQTDWTPSVATGATTGRLVAVEGPLTAGIALGDYAVAYKARGLFMGQFVGAAQGTWAWQLMSGGSNAGAVGPEALCDIGGAIFSVGEDDFWLFDGVRPVPIGQDVREWFRLHCSPVYRYRIKCSYDRQRQLVWIAFPSSSSLGLCDRCLVLHVPSKQWGRSDFVTEAHITYQSPGVTYDTSSGTFDSAPPLPIDSPFWVTGARQFSYFDAVHTINSRSGESVASSFTTGDVGDDNTVSLLEYARVRHTRAPASATATALSRILGSTDYVAGAAEPLFQGRFTPRQSANWHAMRFDFAGDHAETAFEIMSKPDAEQ
jgi:hypothetical protein